MKSSILCLGKIMESFYRDAVAEYAKRLSRYGKLEILEVADEKTPDEPSEAHRLQILKKEGERLKKVLAKDAFHVAPAIDGQKMDSGRFAARLEQLGVSGVSHVQFLIGGSLGLDQELLNGADLKLSFSDMTFPHQLMRVILLEQIYRAQRITSGEPYHK